MSARRVEQLCARGRVSVGEGGTRPTIVCEGDGPFEGLEALVFGEDRVFVDGRRVVPRPRHDTLVFNKPRSVTSTVNDPRGKRDLSGYMASMPGGSFPIGRLDRETTGLLLFTTDGDLCNALLRPEHHTEKLYWLWLDGAVSDDDPRLRRLIDGIEVQGRLLRAKSVAVQSRTQDVTELLVTLDEGRNRQIRRMCRAVGLHLLHLHRKRVGNVTLDDVPQGKWRLLAPDEVDALWQSTGGRARVRRRQIAALARRARTLREQERTDERLERWLRHSDATERCEVACVDPFAVP